MVGLMYFDYHRIFGKKTKSSTLVETLVASVIIVLVFSFASLTLNNIFKGKITKDVSIPENRINELIYLYQNERIKFPYDETFGDWEISIQKQIERDLIFIHAEAEHSKWNGKMHKKVVYGVE